MKVLKIIGLSLLGLVLLLVIVGFFFPAKVTMERSIVINASQESVFRQLNELPLWEGWSPWKAMDPEMKITYSQQTSGTSAWYTWEGEKAGKGKLTITSSKPFSEVITALEFDGQSGSSASFHITPEANGQSKLVWGFDSDMGSNPFMRIMGAIMKGFLEDQYDQGLAKIKELAEKNPVVHVQWKGRTEEPKEVEIPEQHYLYVHDTASVGTISQKLGRAYGMIGEAAAKQKRSIVGAPFGIYYSESNSHFEFDAAMPVDAAAVNSGEVKAGKRAKGKALLVSFFGDYSQTPMAHEKAAEYLTYFGKKQSGAPWEEYVTDPMMEKDTAKWLTNIYYPLP